MREIQFYKTASGQSPIEDFLDRLSARQAQKITWVLKIVEEMDRVPSQYFKKMINTDNLWEVRATASSNTFRLIGFFDGDKIVIISHAFQKKTQKTPKKPYKLLKSGRRII